MVPFGDHSSQNITLNPPLKEVIGYFVGSNYQDDSEDNYYLMRVFEDGVYLRTEYPNPANYSELDYVASYMTPDGKIHEYRPPGLEKSLSGKTTFIEVGVVVNEAERLRLFGRANVMNYYVPYAKHYINKKGQVDGIFILSYITDDESNQSDPLLYKVW